MNAIGGLVRKGDISLFYLFNRKIHCDFLDFLMKNITHLGSTTFTTLLSLFLFFYPKEEVRLIGTKMMISLLTTVLIVQFIKRTVNRPRPYITFSDIIPINPPNCSYSFPSGHTCAAFSMAIILSKNFPPHSLVFITLAIMVGLSRIYLGVHYPTDTIIGATLAFIASNLLIMVGLI
ncbi:phosphatase PAP2 family protein [Alkaliphilus peptidifermentans]|uniref:Undecaprenyl-diphosphatase n=1 Tax=Alkaliphilus peptidifermentans DSM 18978 TaxID=1120976 RepID=A0A1G5EUV5_9FIRM|nr:phosphatase PAP2 family protein [Alkaliphilus peptidifermentans]SCY30218.1 undecaprenyl-diphosphatase [Alkaliphilus peptidifermentans DSM 18978]